MKTTAAILLFCLLIFAGRADEATPSEELQLSYVHAIDAYQLLGRTIPEIADVVKSIDLERNCLVLNSKHPDVEKVREVIKAIDSRPQQVRLDAVISVKAADGREKVISRPTMYTLDGKSTTFWVAEIDGVAIKVEVTPLLE